MSLSIPFHFSIFFAFTVRHVLSKWLKFILTAPIYEVKFPLQFKKLKGKNTLTQFCDRSHVTSSTGHLLSEPFTVTVRHLIYLKVFNVFKHAYRSSCYQLVHLSIRTGYHIEHIYWMCESFNTLNHFQSRFNLSDIRVLSKSMYVICSRICDWSLSSQLLVTKWSFRSNLKN